VATLTLEELKAENATKTEDTVEDSLQETTIEDTEDDAAEEDTTDLEGNADPESEEEEGTVEDWMQSDEQTSQEPKFTDSDMGNVRRKLKAKLGEKDDELSEKDRVIADLQAKLKTNNSQPEAPNSKRPRLEDFDHDTEAYEAATENYFSNAIDSRFAKHTQSAQQDEAVAVQKRAREQAVDKHYERAAKLVAEGTITTEAYHDADLLIRSSLEQVRPGMGENLADTFISKMQGEGSEKVWFHIGRNQTALSKLKETLTTDPSGLDSMLYLGELKTRLTASPTKRVSRAPKPGSTLKGGDGSSAGANAFKKKYQAAVSSGDMQGRIDLRREAKAAGHDPSNW
tara:strand:- start:566 stop:1591 length:1026 start_codon:yes stop_codon:yes gene_type:complete